VRLLKNFPAFYGTLTLITVFTRALHWSLSCQKIQFTPPHPTSLTPIFILLSTHLRLGLPSGLFPSGFPTNILSFIQKIRPDPRPFVTFRNRLILLRWCVVSPTPNPQTGRLPFVGCPRLLIQYIRNVETRDPPNTDKQPHDTP
jgi:hypothetical protein